MKDLFTTKKMILSIHAFLILLMTLLTITKLRYVSIPVYLVFITSFTAPIFLSLNNLIESKRGVFGYLISILLFLGFPFKFSACEIVNGHYIEPTGLFQYTTAGFTSVFTTSSIGITGLTLSLLISNIFLKNISIENMDKPIKSFKYLPAIILLGMSSLMAILNLRYNIILFGMSPEIILPFKGNAIFFLILTRFIPVALFYYSIRNFSYTGVFMGGLLFTIISIGVISRMVIIMYFIVIGVCLIQNCKKTKINKTILQSIFLTIIFCFTTYSTAYFSTSLRYVLNKNMSRDTKLLAKDHKRKIPLPTEKVSRKATSTQEITSKNKSVSLKLQEAISISSFDSTLTAIYSLATRRWVGMEGLMAVVAHPQKNFSLQMDAFKEPSFKGDGKSFFNAIADLKLTEMMKEMKEHKNISTTVPGPIAFFFYSGSHLFLILAMTLSCLLITMIEHFIEKIFRDKSFISIFISVFMTFDFYQFGISPISFLKYWVFSFSVIFFWYSIESKYYKKIIYNLKSKYLIKV